MKVSVSPEITNDSVAAHLESSVEGSPVPFDDHTLSEISDITKIKKTYKLGALASPGGKANPSQSNGVQEDGAKPRLERSMLGAIALRGS